MQKSSQYLNKAIDVLNEAVFVYDENMQIKYNNSAAEKITGHRKEDVIGKNASPFSIKACV